MDASTRQLVDFALSARYEALDRETIHQCKRRLIDSLGCAVGAFADPVCTSLRQMAQDVRAPRMATLWGTPHQGSAELAAMCNGVMVRMHDFNDTYFCRTDGGHPSDILAAILAVAESVHADGRSTLLAVTTGYEVFCRFMQSVDVSARNFDQPVFAAVATALAAGQLARLDAARLGHALALAVVPNLALRQTRQGQLSHWKGCATADAARKAIFAVDLAARGITGPSDVFDGKQGLKSVVGPFEWAAPADWVQMKMVGATHLKSLPVCYHGLAAAQAAIELHPSLRGHEVETVDVSAYEEAVRMIGTDPSRWAPQSRETADHSMPFIVATCLLHGSVDADSFDEAVLHEPDIVALMKRIRVQASAAHTAGYPKGAPASVDVRTRSGARFSAEVSFPKGHIDAPMSDAEVEDKFRRLADRAGGSAACDEMLQRLWSAEQCSDFGAQVLPGLARLCRA